MHEHFNPCIYIWPDLSYSLYPHMPSAHTHRDYHIHHHFIHFPSQTSSSPVTCPLLSLNLPVSINSLLSPPCYPCLSYFLVILRTHEHAPEIWSLHPRHPIPSLWDHFSFRANLDHQECAMATMRYLILQWLFEFWGHLVWSIGGIISRAAACQDEVYEA